MSEKRLNLLFTSAGRRSYLIEFFKEALGDSGRVFAANSNWISTALHAADESVVTPLIYSNEYIPFLLEYCNAHQIDAIIPLFDIDSLVLSKHRLAFEERGTRIITADSTIVDICNDKWKTYTFLKENGFPSIPSFLSLKDAKNALDSEQIKYPLIVKPRWGMGSIAIYQADNDEELRVLFNKAQREVFNSYLKYESIADSDQCVMIQQRIVGQEYGMDNICDLNGNYITTVLRKKLGMRSGETDCAEIVENNKLSEVAKELALLTKHCAIMDIDVIISENVPYILEMNARFGGGYPFSHIAGVNLPRAIVSWLRGEDADDMCFSIQYGTIAQKGISIISLNR